MILFSVICFILFCIGLKSQNYANTFNKKKVSVLKPFLALGIVFSHLSHESAWLSDFQRWGPLIVGIFFFISGYGLTSSLQNKADYMDNFVSRRIIKALMPSYLVAVMFNFVLNESFANYSIASHLFNRHGPSLIPNDWFVFALVYCYLVFWIGANSKSKVVLPMTLFLGPLLFVLFAFKMGWGRNWWASTMAFTIGASYQNLEAIIMRKISNKRGYIIANFSCFLFFSVLVALSSLYGSQLSIVMAYSMLPLWVVFILVPFDCNKIVRHRIIIIGSAISYELFLVHGFIIDFIHQHLPLTGMLFVLLALIFSLLAAAILKLIVQCVERIKAGVCF